ncbi:MAG TPA: hypothetical protein VL096_03045, partial [Pirellulaceae bacterium]|nr:hypothetical protein [Pirellulaceae bacterium]
GATEQARADRTVSEVTKLHGMVMERYEGYRVRPLPIKTVGNASQRAQQRLSATWELMRMELPDRKSDIFSSTKTLPNVPSLCLAYQRRASALCGATVADNSAWTVQYEGAECLYLIISAMRDGDTNGLDYFSSREIGDVDGDQMPEILDAWGTPISFLRWAPGFVSKMQECNPATQPDPFDPFKLYASHFALVPLIFSAGPDKAFDIAVDGSTPIVYSALQLPNCPYAPYVTPPSTTLTTALGSAADANTNGRDDSQDNITNHFIEVR